MTLSPIANANPKANYLAHQAEIDQAVQRVLHSGFYILGEEVAAFERAFGQWMGVNHAAGVASGTDALELCLRACGVGPGDLVLTVANTAVATAAAVERSGAGVVFVDIDPRTYTMDPNCLEDTLRRLNTPANHPGSIAKAVIPVHLYGLPADMGAILEIAERYNLAVIEDCAQAHGARWQGCKAGTFGHMAAFSFYPTKNLGALGDGGAVITNDAGLAKKVSLLRQYGWRERYISAIPGINSRLDPLQAAVLNVKLPYLDEENEQRRRLAEAYNQRLAGSGLALPFIPPGAVHVYHQYTLRTSRRDDLLRHLHSRGILAQVLYPVPIHLQPAYRGRVMPVTPLEKTEQAAGEILSIPIYPELDAESAERVAEAIQEAAGFHEAAGLNPPA